MYGIVIVLGEQATLYSINELQRHKKINRVQTRLPGRTRRGGQSAARIGRLRDEHIHRYITLVEDAIIKAYTHKGVTTIRKLILSGPGPKKEQVRDRVRKKLGVPIELLNLDSFSQVLQYFQDIHGHEEKVDAKKSEEEILDYIRTNPERLAFGNEVNSALKRGLLQKVWVQDNNQIPQSPHKTQIIRVAGHFLDDFGRIIGLRWF